MTEKILNSDQYALISGNILLQALPESIQKIARKHKITGDQIKEFPDHALKDLGFNAKDIGDINTEYFKLVSKRLAQAMLLTHGTSILQPDRDLD